MEMIDLYACVRSCHVCFSLFLSFLGMRDSLSPPYLPYSQCTSNLIYYYVEFVLNTLAARKKYSKNNISKCTDVDIHKKISIW